MRFSIEFFLLVAVAFLLLGQVLKEKFLTYGYADRPVMSTDYPYWWNPWYYLPGSKRNMSHDLRGDPWIPFYQVSPWNNPSTMPLRNRRMIIGA